MKPYLFFTLMALSATLLLQQGCSTAAKQPAGTAGAVAIHVKVATAKVGAAADPIHATGLLVSKNEAKLAFKTGGVIEKIYVNEGDLVRRGQVLASLNLAEIDAQVTQARVAHEKALRDLNRIKALYVDSVTTLENLQNASTLADQTAASLQVAEFNRSYSVITAPTNGRILRRTGEVGELISANKDVFTLGSSEAAWIVKAGLTDEERVQVHLGDPARIVLDAYPGDTLKAVVSQLAQATDAASGSYTAELQLLPTGKPLISGFVANAYLLPARLPAVLLIPIEAVVEADNDSAFVFQPIGEGSVKKVRIAIGAPYGSQIEVRSGLKAGDAFITAGAPYLSPDSHIIITR